MLAYPRDIIAPKHPNQKNEDNLENEDDTKIKTQNEDNHKTEDDLTLKMTSKKDKFENEDGFKNEDNHNK